MMVEETKEICGPLQTRQATDDLHCPVDSICRAGPNNAGNASEHERNETSRGKQGIDFEWRSMEGMTDNFARPHHSSTEICGSAGCVTLRSGRKRVSASEQVRFCKKGRSDVYHMVTKSSCVTVRQRLLSADASGFIRVEDVPLYYVVCPLVQVEEPGTYGVAFVFVSSMLCGSHCKLEHVLRSGCV